MVLRRPTKSAGSAEGSGEEGWMNSPGSLSVIPYTSSAVVHWRSSFRADLIPSRTQGSASTNGQVEVDT